MSKKIHPSDIDQEKQVFEVTLPKFSLENIYVCIGNDYEHNKMVRYNIYNVDKGTRKVTENIGYYEFTKDKDRSELLDSDGDFKVMELGEENMTIHEEFIAKMSKSQRTKAPKPAPVEIPKKTGLEADSPSPIPVALDVIDVGANDDEGILSEYFNNDKEMNASKVVAAYTENFVKPRKWVNEIGVSATGIHTNTYIIVISDGVQHTMNGEPVKPDPGDGKYVNFQMGIYPSTDELPYDPTRKYVLLLYAPRTHYRLLEHDGKVSFNESELPQKIIDRVCVEHHPTEPKVKGVDNSLEFSVITTTTGGDCFFDAVYRATKPFIDIHADKDAYLTEVHAFREEVAKAVLRTNKVIQGKIKKLYNLFSQKDLNTIRDKFYKNKFSRSPVNGDEDDTVFQSTHVALFKLYDETELSFNEKDHLLTTYLTLLYEFFPNATPAQRAEFETKYSQVYSKGNRDMHEPLEMQRAELTKILASKPPVEEPKPKAKAKIVVVEEPAPEPPKPVEQPAAKQVNVPAGTDPVVASIIEIYNSSDSLADKKTKLEKFKRPQLAAAWEIVKEQVPGMKNPSPLNAPDFINCLANDPAHTCNKKRETKKNGGSDNNNQTRRRKI